MIAFAVVFTSVLLAAEPAAEARGQYWRKGEMCMMRRINRARQNHGMGRLDWDKQLGYVGRVHARTLARNGGVWHDYRVDDRVTRWYRLGQNTGRGVRCRRLVRSFMRSYSHRANILGSWRHVGVGLVDSGRYIYVQVLFESRRDPGNIWHYP